MFSKMRIEIKYFFHKNAFERIVCEMVAILSRDRGGWGGGGGGGGI